MALIARSSEMSFSASRLLRTLRSMSTYVLLEAFDIVVAQIVEMTKLNLDAPRPQLGVAERLRLTGVLKGYARLVRADNAALGGRGPIPVRSGSRTYLHGRDNQPSDRAPPVARLGQRPVDARR